MAPLPTKNGDQAATPGFVASGRAMDCGGKRSATPLTRYDCGQTAELREVVEISTSIVRTGTDRGQINREALPHDQLQILVTIMAIKTVETYVWQINPSIIESNRVAGRTPPSIVCGWEWLLAK